MFKRRVGSLLLSILMIITYMPFTSVPALAMEDGTELPEEITEDVLEETPAEADVVTDAEAVTTEEEAGEPDLSVEEPEQPDAAEPDRKSVV